jgi:hypothetical protein
MPADRSRVSLFGRRSMPVPRQQTRTPAPLAEAEKPHVVHLKSTDSLPTPAAFMFLAGIMLSACSGGHSVTQPGGCDPNLAPSGFTCGPNGSFVPATPSCSTTTLQTDVEADLNNCSGKIFATESVACGNSDTAVSAAWSTYCSCLGAPLNGTFQNPQYHYFAQGGGVMCPPGAGAADPCQSGGGVLISVSQYPNTCGAPHFPPSSFRRQTGTH